MQTTHSIIISTINGDIVAEVTNKQFEELHNRLTMYYNENYEVITNKDD